MVGDGSERAEQVRLQQRRLAKSTNAPWEPPMIGFPLRTGSRAVARVGSFEDKGLSSASAQQHVET